MPTSIQDRSRGQAVSRASWVICATSASTVISRSADEPAEHMPGFIAPGLQFAEPDRGAGRRRVVRDVHEPEEQAACQPLFLAGRLPYAASAVRVSASLIPPLAR